MIADDYVSDADAGDASVLAAANQLVLVLVHVHVAVESHGCEQDLELGQVLVVVAAS